MASIITAANTLFSTRLETQSSPEVIKEREAEGVVVSKEVAVVDAVAMAEIGKGMANNLYTRIKFLRKNTMYVIMTVI